MHYWATHTSCINQMAASRSPKNKIPLFHLLSMDTTPFTHSHISCSLTSIHLAKQHTALKLHCASFLVCTFSILDFFICHLQGDKEAWRGLFQLLLLVCSGAHSPDAIAYPTCCLPPRWQAAVSGAVCYALASVLLRAELDGEHSAFFFLCA